MKKCTALAVWGVCVLFMLSAAALTTPSEPWDLSNPGDELNLWEIYNTLYGATLSSNADLNALQRDMEIFNLGGHPVGFVEAQARYAGATQRFGYYFPVDGSPGFTITELFNVTTSGLLSGYVATLSSVGDFGFYLHPEGSRASGDSWYSQDALNGGDEHMLVYITPSPTVFLLAWEDRGFGISDLDYNDFVVELSFDSKNIAPEPASMLLLGMGIAGMAAAKFRKGLS